MQEGWLSPMERAPVSAHFDLPWIRPWDNRGKCYIDGKRIQCLSNATYRSMYPSIFNLLRATVRYWSEIATFSYPLHLAPPLDVLFPIPIGIPGNLSLFLRKLESWGYQAVKMQFDDRLSRFDTYQRVTDKQTDGRTDVQPAYSY